MYVCVSEYIYRSWELGDFHKTHSTVDILSETPKRMENVLVNTMEPSPQFVAERNVSLLVLALIEIPLRNEECLEFPRPY